MSRAAVGASAALAAVLAALVLRACAGRAEPGAAARPVDGVERAVALDRELQSGAPAPEVASHVAAARDEVSGEERSEGVVLGVDAPEPPEGADPVGYVVHGRVSGPPGPMRALRDPWLRFERADGESLLARANAAGDYAITGLAPGEWIVRCGVRGYRSARFALDLGAERVLRRDVVLEPAVILKVALTTPDGRPFFEALRELAGWKLYELVPIATAEAPGRTFEGVRGSLNNHYGVGGFWQNGMVYEALPPEYYGVLVLDGDLPVHVSLVLKSVVLASQRVDPGMDEVRFTLAPEALLERRSALVCRVVASGGEEPIEGASLHLMGGHGFTHPHPKSDARGELRAEADPGEYDLVVMDDGRGTLRKRVVLPAGETLDLGTLTLEPATRVEGRVVAEDGAPVGLPRARQRRRKRRGGDGEVAVLADDA